MPKAKTYKQCKSRYYLVAISLERRLYLLQVDVSKGKGRVILTLPLPFDNWPNY